MGKRIVQGLGVLIMMLLVTGCAGTQSIKTRAFVEDRPRVDQSMKGGNYGYIYGTPVPPDRSKLKKTRKVYVVEFSKEEEPPEDVTDVQPVAPAPQPRVSAVLPPPREAPRPAPESKYSPIVLPNFDEQSAPAPAPAAAQPASGGKYVDYTIQKNDTLQKISKKFYDTYRKWNLIYEANKAKIPDPNRIKPGVTIRIPTQ
jgi:nucleoid-associated protein YgaU